MNDGKNGVSVHHDLLFCILYFIWDTDFVRLKEIKLKGWGM